MTLTLGLAAILFGIGFNLPYMVLAFTFDYPAILRRPPAEILTAFDAGGATLVLTWWAFGLAALLLVPLSIALAITPARMTSSPALAIGAALAGGLAGLAQAIGLFRWVSVVPDLARAHAAGCVQPR